MKRVVSIILIMVMVLAAATALASGKSKKSSNESIVIETYNDNLDWVEVAHTEIITVDGSHVHHEGDQDDYQVVHYTEIHQISPEKPDLEVHHWPVDDYVAVTPVYDPEISDEVYVEIGYPVAEPYHHIPVTEYHWPVDPVIYEPVTPVAPFHFHWPWTPVLEEPVSPVTPIYVFHWPLVANPIAVAK